MYIVQKKNLKKKLAGALFIDVKKAFDYVSKNQLSKRIIVLGINKNLIA